MISKYIHGNSITLRPALPVDREDIYVWLTGSNLTSSMMGPPLFPEIPIPTRKEFDADYNETYFTDDDPLAGRSYIIMANEQAVGHINYNPIHTDDESVEVDIWMRDASCTQKGYGTDAITTLCNFLHQQFGCRRFFLAPSARNEAAIRAYRKAGFEVTRDIPGWFDGDYEDVEVMVKIV